LAEELLREHGVELLLNRTVRSVEADVELCRVRLDDGQELLADAVVVAVGAVPATQWLEGSGLEIDDGITCDAALRAVGADRVVVAGDVARWPSPVFPGSAVRIEHWNNAIEQGACAARTLLAGDDAAPFASVPTFWSDHFGVRLRSVGLPGIANHFEVVAGDLESRQFAAAGYRDGQLVGGVTYGIPRALARIRSQLSANATVTTEA
jgi:NADPH-dependent 2,4-dienoyl-CoA reductase/sulfur reductase-like enzyme